VIAVVIWVVSFPNCVDSRVAVRLTEKYWKRWNVLDEILALVTQDSSSHGRGDRELTSYPSIVHANHPDKSNIQPVKSIDRMILKGLRAGRSGQPIRRPVLRLPALRTRLT